MNIFPLLNKTSIKAIRTTKRNWRKLVSGHSVPDRLKIQLIYERLLLILRMLLCRTTNSVETHNHRTVKRQRTTAKLQVNQAFSKNFSFFFRNAMKGTTGTKGMFILWFSFGVSANKKLNSRLGSRHCFSKVLYSTFRLLKYLWVLQGNGKY